MKSDCSSAVRNAEWIWCTADLISYVGEDNEITALIRGWFIRHITVHEKVYSPVLGYRSNNPNTTHKFRAGNLGSKIESLAYCEFAALTGYDMSNFFQNRFHFCKLWSH